MMKPFSFILKATTIAVVSAFSTGSLGHSEHEKPRYVAPFGVDSGACDSVESPCLTISYAAAHSNKGDQVLVAAGDYRLGDVDSIFYLLSDMIKVKAGYSAADQYQQRSLVDNVTRLSGVPLEFADALRKKGFVVISDLKGMSQGEKTALDAKMAGFNELSQSQSDMSCVDGQAGAFECHRVDLLSHLALSDFDVQADFDIGSGNDIWGYVDLNTGREYAIMGFTKGFSVIDVTDPSAPSIVGSIPGQVTTWRDIKVHQYFDTVAGRWKAYAYVTADRASVGLTIVDLNDLANGISVANVDKTDISAHNVFISNVDYSTGVALTGMEPIVHLAGANNNSGAFNSYRINTDETAVAKAYTPSDLSGYSHDVSAMVIKDDRVGSQCTEKNGACEIFFDYNEKEVKIWDKSNNDSPNVLSQFTYASASYVHSGWTSEDGQYVFVHDELDEMMLGENTKLRVYDISDLSAPTPAGSWEGGTQAIDHNGFVRGNRYYMSNYEKGLTILDITNPRQPEQVGTFDTFPLSDNAVFNGAWGVYPFLPSGNILVSDIVGGLFVLKDNTLGTDEYDSLKFNAKHYEVEEGKTLTIEVERLGAVEQAVTVQYETHAGSASTDDFMMTSGTLSWAAGDSASKLIEVNVSEDVFDEETPETFFIRMFNPTGGASLAAPNISPVTITGKPQPPSASFASNEVMVKEIDGMVAIPVVRRGDTGESLTINYSVAGGSATQGSDYQLETGSLTWAAGDNESKQIDITLTDDNESESVENIVINLSQETPGNAIESINVAVRDDESNQGPTLTITDDMTVSGGVVVNLAAVANDPEGYPLAYQWVQTAGSSVSIEDESASVISFAVPRTAAQLTFELTVTDDFGVEAKDSVTITVEAAQQTQDATQSVSSGGGGALYLLSLLGLFGLRRRIK